jgi:hypothetical protein
MKKLITLCCLLNFALGALSQQIENPQRVAQGIAVSEAQPVAHKALRLLWKGGSRKRGKVCRIDWEGGAANQVVTIELFRVKGRGREKLTIATVPNTGEFSWNIPIGQKLGVYQVHATCGQETVESKSFKMRRKVPTAVKLLPVIIGVPVVAVVVIMRALDNMSTGLGNSLNGISWD